MVSHSLNLKSENDCRPAVWSSFPKCKLSISIKYLDSQDFEVLLFSQSLNHVQVFATPWTAARQSPLSFTISWSLLKFMCIEHGKQAEKYEMSLQVEGSWEE